jgi:hypothetical protein
VPCETVENGQNFKLTNSKPISEEQNEKLNNHEGNKQSSVSLEPLKNELDLSVKIEPSIVPPSQRKSLKELKKRSKSKRVQVHDVKETSQHGSHRSRSYTRQSCKPIMRTKSLVSQNVSRYESLSDITVGQDNSKLKTEVKRSDSVKNLAELFNCGQQTALKHNTRKEEKHETKSVEISTDSDVVSPPDDKGNDNEKQKIPHVAVSKTQMVVVHFVNKITAKL